MKIAVAGDSAGEGLSRILAEYLSDRYEVSEISHTDAGPDPFYANLADRVGSAVMSGSYDRAILVCGTGIGGCIAANKVPGIRAALVSDPIPPPSRHVEQRPDRDHRRANHRAGVGQDHHRRLPR